jgi:putative transposase
MAYRKEVLANGQTYHIFNRTIDRKRIFVDKRTCLHAMMCLWYYQSKFPMYSFSKYLRLRVDVRGSLYQQILELPKQVEILSFSLMPNHFHLLVTQKSDNGITKYLSNFQNSFAKYYNTKYERKGSLFEEQFGSVRMEADEQLIHSTRYIHLQAFTSFLVKDYQRLKKYPWSSLPEYLGTSQDPLHKISNPKPILEYFKSSDDYERFLTDQAAYQQELHILRDQTFEQA